MPQNTVEGEEEFPCVAPAEPDLSPFLTLPTSCTGPSGMRTGVEVESWVQPGLGDGEYVPLGREGEAVGLDGCNRLPFAPSLGAAPDGTAGSTPTGLSTVIHVPQETLLNPTGLAESNVRQTTFVLPEGVQISPAGADGLLACSPAQIALNTPDAATCPDASKVGTVEVKSPLLPDSLVGSMYLAAQDENPFGSLVAVYLEAEDSKAGVLFKVAGQVSLDPVTGQITAVFPEDPQLPFSELDVHFFGSDRAPLTTPAYCGAYTTVGSFVPWSGNAPVGSSSTFDIDSGPLWHGLL